MAKKRPSKITPVTYPDRRYTVDELYKELVEGGRNFKTYIHPLFMNRCICRADIRELIRRGLTECMGSYKILTRQFNMQVREYKWFLNFLRKHECQLDFAEFRRPRSANSDQLGIGQDPSTRTLAATSLT